MSSTISSASTASAASYLGTVSTTAPAASPPAGDDTLTAMAQKIIHEPLQDSFQPAEPKAPVALL